MEHQDLIPHLFRTEFRKIVSVLCRIFSLEHMEIAEDIAGETFLLALQTWSYKGVPENPAAWLYQVAKNKTKNYLTRHQLFSSKIARQISQLQEKEEEIDIDLSEKNMEDSQLQMLFALCHPSIPPEAQIGLSLRILCGFGIEEIATAFLTTKETINKRLSRAREKLRSEKISMDLPLAREINNRLDTVLRTLYLLFSEGYYSESQDIILRKDFCLEAMRLTTQLTEYELTNKPEVNALLSLMCFHASRFEARTNSQGEIILYEDQDESLWNQNLVAKGIFYLHLASTGNKLSKYHLEAAIAYWHTQKADTQEKWENILLLYNQLLQLEYSPVAALNRTYALYKANGKEEAIAAAEKLELRNNHFYFTLLGELYRDLDKEKAIQHFQKARDLAKNSTDRHLLSRKINEVNEEGEW
ncbi:MAG: RNA polymerase sigma factor [Flavisolibacter sp.]